MLTGHPRPPRPRHRPRARVVALVALLPVLLLTACAEVNRIVLDRYTVSDGAGGPEPALRWESNRYPDFEARVSDDCWRAARIGDPVSEDCVSTLSTVLEGDPYRANAPLALLASALFSAALLAVALRLVAWRPAVTPPTEATRTSEAQPPDADLVRVMRATDAEKDAQAIADRAGRDTPRPGVTGLALGALLLVPPMLIVGYGATLAWVGITAILLFAALALLELLVLLPMSFRVTNSYPAVPRMLFVAGIAASFLTLAIAGSFIPTPLVDLHGLAWLA